MFCSKTKLEACAAVSIIEWNTGAAGTNNFFKKISVNCGINTFIGSRKPNDVRISAAAQKNSPSYKKFRQQFRQQRKRKGPHTASYQFGAFSTKKQPDINNETNSEEKTTKPLFINALKIELFKINWILWSECLMLFLTP